MTGPSGPIIQREQRPTRGRYFIQIEGTDAEAELAYSRSGKNLIIAEHTSVDDRLRGRGLALALVTRLVEDARAEGVKIYPLCPYVNAEWQKHPDWADVFQS